MNRRTDRLESDAGLTLVEMLVTVFVGAIVLSLVATIFTTTLQATAATRDRDLATGRAQAISTSLTTSVRNAAAATVPTAGGGSVLRARVATGASGWECRAWAVVDLEKWTATGRSAGADGSFELRYRTYAPLGSSAPVPTPTAAWSVLAEHVQRTTVAATAQPYFALDANQRLTWKLEVVASEQPQLSDQSVAPVAGSAVVVSRQEGAAVRCW